MTEGQPFAGPSGVAPEAEAFETCSLAGGLFGDRPIRPSVVLPATEVKESATPTVAESHGSGVGFRLRPRGKATRALERMVGGSSGWWRDLSCSTPARAALSWMRAYMAPGVRLGGVRLVERRGEDGGLLDPIPIVQAFFSSEESSRCLWVCPALVAELQGVRCFRAPGPEVLSSLRSRARLWARDAGVGALDYSLFLPGTLVVASLPQPAEVVAVGALRGSASRWAQDVLVPLGAGRAVPPRSPSWLRVLSIIFRLSGDDRDPLRAGAPLSFGPK